MQITNHSFTPELYSCLFDHLPKEENYIGDVPWSFKYACMNYRTGMYNVITIDDVPTSGSGVICLDNHIVQLGWRGWSNVKYPTKTGFNFKYALPRQIQWSGDREMVITFNPHNHKLKEAFKRGIEGKRGEEMKKMLEGFIIPQHLEIFNNVEQWVFRKPISS